MKLLIEVNQNDIDNGVQGVSCKCPVARAIKRTMRIKGVEVNADYILLKSGKTSIECAVPASVMRFINIFDEGAKVKPFKFNLNIEGI